MPAGERLSCTSGAASHTRQGENGMLVNTLAIPGHPEHVRAARTFTALVLAAHSRDDDGTAGLLVSELVTNSLLHSDSAKPGGIITVTVAISPGETLIQVTDEGGPTEPT